MWLKVIQHTIEGQHRALSWQYKDFKSYWSHVKLMYKDLAMCVAKTIVIDLLYKTTANVKILFRGSLMNRNCLNFSITDRNRQVHV